MNKLSTKDRQRVSDALAECARETKNIDNPSELSDAAFNLLSKKLGDNPGLFKAACQVYNSCKSIHKLSEADDKTRGDSFSILNVQELSDRLAKSRATNLKKAASAPAVFTVVRNRAIQKAEKPLDKKASASKDTKTPQEEVKLDCRRYLRDAVQDMENLINKYAAALKAAECRESASFDRFVTAFATEPRHIRKEAAARLHANFSELADELFTRFATVRPMQKLAAVEYKGKYRGTPSLPDTGLYKAAMEAMIATEDVRQAQEFYRTAVKSLAEDAMDLTRKYTGLDKQAAGAGLATAVTGGASAGMGSTIAKTFFGEGDDISSEALRKKIYNTELTNALLSHGSKRAFMHAVQDPTISKYALHKIVTAFNKAIAKLPPNAKLVPATANQQLIESLMIDALATGSVPSKADTEVISTLADTLGKLQTNQGVYKGNNPDAE